MTLAKVVQPMTQFGMEAAIAGLESRMNALEIKHNSLVRALEYKEVAQEDLAIWWEAFRSASSGCLVDSCAFNQEWVDGVGKFANCALAAYKAKAAELAGKK